MLEKIDTGFLALAEKNLRSNGSVVEVIEYLTKNLYEVRQALPFEEWRKFATVDCRQHTIMQILQQDPFIWRALNKPRGYAGDGETMDFVFGPEDGCTPLVVQDASEIGQRLYAYTAHTEGPRAVRARRNLIAERINVNSERKPGQHILSVACGHLREAKYIKALQAGTLGRCVAMDHDSENLAVVKRDFGALGVETFEGSIRNILRRRLPEGGFDFIYTAGLYDYLAMPLAQKITEILFARLNPGGRLLLANYLPDFNVTGFTEAILDWWLIYRSRPELLTIAETLPQEEIACERIFVEDHGCIGLLEVEKR